MDNFILFAILGVGAGATYAILGLGIVIVHRGSGTVNFAHGAIAGFAALCFADLVSHGMPLVPAMLLTLTGGAVFGAIFHLTVMKALARAPALARIVATLGLLITLQGAAEKIWNNPAFSAPSLFPQNSISIFGVEFGVDRLYVLGVTILISAALWALYRFTTFGVATRATSENERGAALLGYSPDLIGACNWALGCVLASFAGIIIAPIALLDIGVMSLLILPALAAALVGRFSSFSVTCAVGIAIGMAQSLLTYYWDQPGVTEALPFAIVIVAMIVTGKLIPSRGGTERRRPPLSPTPKIRPMVNLGLIALVMAGLIFMSPEYESAIAASCIVAAVALSLVVVTGFVGQISLAQMAFAGIAGLITSKLSINAGIPFPWPILLAGVSMVPIGVVVGLPALRVRGINLAIVTLGVSVAVSGVLFGNLAWIGGLDGSKVQSPSLWGFSLDATLHPMRFGVFALFVLVVLTLMVQALRVSATGRRMLAVRSNERAAAATGVDVRLTKLQAFAFSSLLAGLGGGVLAYQLGSVAFERFDPMASILILALAYIGGIAVTSGALVAGLLANGGVLYVLLSSIGGIDAWWSILAGVGVLLTAVTQPDGISIAYMKQGLWIRDRFRRRRAGHGGQSVPKASRVGAGGPG